VPTQALLNYAENLFVLLVRIALRTGRPQGLLPTLPYESV